MPHYKGRSDVFHLMSCLSPLDHDLAHVPIRWNRLIDKNMRQIKILSMILSQKWFHFCGSCSSCLTLAQWRRDWTSAIRPHASAGVFKVKQQIPRTLDQMGLE